MNYAEKAKKLFEEGFNCAQAVFLAFADKYDMDEKTALKLSSSFGGGMGRLREVCGAVSGMFMVAGILYGYEYADDYDGKKTHYERIQALAKEFEKENGSIICRRLLGLDEGKDNPTPEVRSAAYYQKRPCVELVGSAAEIMARYIEEFPIPQYGKKLHKA